MPKQKTKKTIAKRFKRTATGKILRYRAGHSHLLTGKSSKRRRRLRKAAVLRGTDRRLVEPGLPG
ncbi:MAG: 50S ribosomal protein L35 [Verrucomicrobia bacterium]|nr:MAG: 50S ribosomal protein L35 [Verrucomicrobiota bacterium]